MCISALVSNSGNSDSPRRSGKKLVGGVPAVEAEAVFIQVALEVHTPSMVGSDQERFRIAQCLVQPFQISGSTVIYLCVNGNIFQSHIGFEAITFNRSTALNMGIHKLLQGLALNIGNLLHPPRELPSRQFWTEPPQLFPARCPAYVF